LIQLNAVVMIVLFHVYLVNSCLKIKAVNVWIVPQQDAKLVHIDPLATVLV
jgi:hypothetical protein